MSLQARLDAFKADFEAGKPPYNVRQSVIETMHRATAELIASGAAGRALNVGDKAPSFALKDPEGAVVNSAALLAGGPLIVSFYRGVWCPYCNMELQALEAAKPEFDRLGATLVAISPQTAPNSRKSVRQNGLTFPILSDPKGEVAAAFGLRFRLPDYLVDLYKSLKNDLPTFNDDPSWTLPMPGRYLIGQDGTILYADVNPDYTIRPEPEALLPALRQAAARSAA
ncbi:MAG: AhpC/TSA family protein [Inquilinus limosus]|uniref:thioredoxin-dependent peroxiredoxin n=1 Tax=Inquilinus limosus TaxID=171674 RepID=A0A952KCQ6_9PROT|nr:AhpC/TSA family protein [Inquilinus limosus]